jgi:8-oxo-dGTP diphosphatase
MTAADISWAGPAARFNLRVAAIINRDGELLLCSVDGLGYWFLPGGRVQFGETSRAALARELAEELGHELPVAELALIVENIHAAALVQHEIGMYYRVIWPDVLARDDLGRGTEAGHLFRWMSPRELWSVRFEPAGLVPVLQQPTARLRHIVLDAV